MYVGGMKVPQPWTWVKHSDMNFPSKDGSSYHGCLACMCRKKHARNLRMLVPRSTGLFCTGLEGVSPHSGCRKITKLLTTIPNHFGGDMENKELVCKGVKVLAKNIKGTG